MGNRRLICGHCHHPSHQTPGTLGRTDFADPNRKIYIPQKNPPFTFEQIDAFINFYNRRQPLRPSFSFGGDGYGPGATKLLHIWDSYKLSSRQQINAVKALQRTMSAAAKRLEIETFELRKLLNTNAQNFNFFSGQENWISKRDDELLELSDSIRKLRRDMGVPLQFLVSSSLFNKNKTATESYLSLNRHFRDIRKYVRRLEKITGNYKNIRNGIENSLGLIIRSEIFRKRLTSLSSFAKGVAMSTGADRIPSVAKYTDRRGRLDKLVSEIEKIKFELRQEKSRASLSLYSSKLGLDKPRKEIISVAKGSIPLEGKSEFKEKWRNVINVAQTLFDYNLDGKLTIDDMD